MMDYRPRLDSSDVDHDSDDRWLSQRVLERRVDEIFRDHAHMTVGICEVPLTLHEAELDRRLERWTPRLRHLGRIHTVGDEVVFHWTVAEFIAHEALHEWWSAIAHWPLGWWPDDAATGPLPELPEELASPEPFSTAEADSRNPLTSFWW